ncbi:unnamed protein product [Schistosoma margrebowiei]|uniref:Uncharacterized protein n=1 Tax=Schistosoma margrebowiei TaxID=48269 RepID=A0A183LEW9_9TREM|nr:unnamed protein product [Schistosoma margrebowiei]
MSKNTYFYSIGYCKDIVNFVINFLPNAQFTYIKKILSDLRPVDSCFVLLWDSTAVSIHQPTRNRN